MTKGLVTNGGHGNDRLRKGNRHRHLTVPVSQLTEIWVKGENEAPLAV